MRLLFIFCLQILKLSFSTTYEKERGLCSFDYTDFDCISDRQNKGVCCRIKGELKYFDNFCLACKNVDLSTIDRDVMIIS